MIDWDGVEGVDEHSVNRFTLGTIVKLKTDSEYYYQTDGLEGVVTPLDQYDAENYTVVNESSYESRSGFERQWWTRVKWKNGMKNVYPTNDLVFVLSPTEPETTVNPTVFNTVPGQIVRVGNTLYAMLPADFEIKRILINGKVEKESLFNQTSPRALNLDTNKPAYIHLDMVDEVTEAFVELICYEVGADYYITLPLDNQKSNFIDGLISEGKPLNFLGIFDEKLQIKLLSFRNN